MSTGRDLGGGERFVKTFLVWDNGLAVDQAIALSRNMDGTRNRVLYYTPWMGAFPKWNDYAVGLGFDDEGLEKVLYFFEYINEADVIVFFDNAAGDLCKFLRDTTGKPVFGAANGEQLENHRYQARQLQSSLGLPTQLTSKVKGVTDLEKHLKDNSDVYVKIDIFRGDVDSFPAKTLESVQPLLDQLRIEYGPFQEYFDFIVEQKIKGDNIVEVGFDSFFSGDWIKPYLYGIEIDKSLYIGKFADQLPTPMQKTADAFADEMRKRDYRGGFSTEEFVTAPDKSYLIDICARFAFPVSAVFPLAIKNWAEFIESVAIGKPVEIVQGGKYFGSLPLSTDFAQEHWVMLNIPPEMRDTVKVRSAAKSDGKYYSVPGRMTSVMVLTAVADTVDELIEKLTSQIDKVSAFKIENDSESQLNKAKENIDNMNKMGFNF